MIDWKFVISSNVEAIAYDKKEHTLWIRFKNGGLYKYFDVPESIYKEMAEAESVGKFFFEKIKRFFDHEKEEKRGSKMEKSFRLFIQPAILPEERHKIEKFLESIGYRVHSGGTMTDMSECDISFGKEE